MSLALNTLRCPAGVSPQRREMVRGALSIGRGVECDWILPDPDRVLSKRHCLLTSQDDFWLVTDVSRNGTFLNGDALDPGVPHALQTGDRLMVGTYEIEARLDRPAESAAPAGASAPWPDAAEEPERLTGDPFGIEKTGPATIDSVIGPADDFEPFDNGPRSGDAALGADRMSDLGGQFRPPRTSLELIPEDWDDDLVPLPHATPPQAPTTMPELASASIDKPGKADVTDGFSAFAAGAGVSGTRHADPRRALGELGAAFRTAVAGLRRMMIARAAIKDEFRIEQTMVRPSGNNPLKFAADDEDALSALIGIGGRRGMSAEQAIAEAVRDMRNHEIAVAQAMQQAMDAVLSALAPAKLLSDLPASAGDAVPGRRRLRAWEAFEAAHARLADTEGQSDSLFGHSFMRAYEAALATLSSGDTPSSTGDRRDLE